MPAVIFSHGFWGTHSVGDGYARALAQKGYVVYCFDFCGGAPGSRSSGSTLEMSFFTEKADLEAVMEKVQGLDYVDRENLFLMGTSQGGAVSAITGADHEEEVQGMSDQLIYEADKIGVVCPVYGHEVPPMVKDLLKNADFKTDYFYMVLTYGDRHGGAAELAKKLCEECWIHPAYINVLIMVDNWLPSFDMEEQVKIGKKVGEHLAAIRKDIENRRRGISEAPGLSLCKRA